jgi:hypothetical protein
MIRLRCSGVRVSVTSARMIAAKAATVGRAIDVVVPGS